MRFSHIKNVRSFLASIFISISSAITSTSAISQTPGQAPEPSGPSPFTVIADGLLNPRQILIDDGTIYVVEAGVGGNGPCVKSFDGLYEDCFGRTGAVRRIRGHQNNIDTYITGLPSMASPSGGFAIGASHIALQGKTILLTIGNGESPSRRAVFSKADQRFGKILTINRKGKEKIFTDLTAFEEKVNPDGEAVIESNPAGIVAANDKCNRYGHWSHFDKFDWDDDYEFYNPFINTSRWLVLDAAGNDLLTLKPNGDLSVRYVFQSRQLLAPAFLGLPSGTKLPVQAVPNSIIEGPDGAYYVAEYTGFPFPKGSARVLRFGCEGKPTVVATGFTNIIDIAFGPDGSLYVLEMATNGIPSGDPTGAVYKITPRGKRILLASQGLVYPTAIAVDRHGNIYVANYGVSAKAQLVRF